MKPCRGKTHAKGRLEGSIVVCKYVSAPQLGLQRTLSCVDRRLPRVLLLGSSGHPFGIFDLDCGEKFLVTQTWVCFESQCALVRKFWVIKGENPNEDA